jgi:hypothetical protein
MPRQQPESPEAWRDRQIITMVNDYVNDILDIAADRIDALDLYDGYDEGTRDSAASIVRNMKRHPK